MKYIFTFMLILAFSSTAGAAGGTVFYEVNGERFEGYYVSPSPDAALVLLIHDWDGLTDYEVKMITYSGAPHAFTVFGSKRYREDVDKKSWKRFTEFLSETLD